MALAGTSRPARGRGPAAARQASPRTASPASRRPAGNPTREASSSGGNKRHPPEAEALGPGRQPQVLNGARAGPHVGVGERGPTQHGGGRRPPVATDDNAQRRLADPVQLEVEHSAPCVLGQEVGLALALPFGDDGSPLTGPCHGHEQEPPRLGVPHRRSGVSRRQDSLHQVGVKRFGPEPPYVPAGPDDVVKRLALAVTETPRLRVGGAVGGGCCVADDGDWPGPRGGAAGPGGPSP